MTRTRERMMGVALRPGQNDEKLYFTGQSVALDPATSYNAMDRAIMGCEGIATLGPAYDRKAGGFVDDPDVRGIYSDSEDDVVPDGRVYTLGEAKKLAAQNGRH